MQKSIRRWLCRHVSYWSERRQGHVCYRCGHFRAEAGPPSRYESGVPGLER